MQYGVIVYSICTACGSVIAKRNGIFGRCVSAVIVLHPKFVLRRNNARSRGAMVVIHRPCRRVACRGKKKSRRVYFDLHFSAIGLEVLLLLFVIGHRAQSRQREIRDNRLSYV
jgi:hypothetical protein